MEDTSFDKEEVIEEMRLLRSKRVAERIEINKQKGIDDVDPVNIANRITIRYLDEMEFEEDGKTVKRNVFEVTEEGQQQAIDYAYDSKNGEFNPLGMRRIIDKNIILAESLSTKSDKEQQKIREGLERKDRSKAKTLEELEEEHKQDEQAKKEQVGEELSESMGEPNLKIQSYRKIIDPKFKEEFPEVCENAEEVLTVQLEDGRVGVVADYGDGKGFQMAKGTELVTPPATEQVYDIDRENQTVEKDTLYAEIPMGNNKSVGVDFGQYGYMETKIVYEAPDSKKVAIDMRQQGDSLYDGTTLAEREEQQRQGTDYAQNLADLVSGEENEQNNRMEEQIVEEVLQSHEEELESLYGTGPEQAEAIRRYIEEATTRRGIIVPEEIQRFVEDSIEADYGQFFRDHTQH